jgi:hypothetical protein
MLFDCPPDDVQVDEGDGSCHAVAYIRTRIFQKSLRITWNTSVEFVARVCTIFLHSLARYNDTNPAGAYRALLYGAVWWIVVDRSRYSHKRLS